MSIFQLKSIIRATCPKRLAPFLKKEIENLGYKVDSDDETGVNIKGTLEDCMKLNLWLRTAHKVLFLVDEFEAQNPDQLYKNLVEIPWEDYISENGYISISSTVMDNPTINDTRFPNLRVKDAVVDRINNKKGKRPNAGTENDKTVLYLFWKRNDASIFIDTSGETIAKHGYRVNPFKAPMQETLAAATIMATEWNPVQDKFINPMCGSGTLAIEAALIARNIAPGLLRSNFGFMHILGFDRNRWMEIKKEASRAENDEAEPIIIASDIDPKAIRAAQANAKEAEVDDLIEFIVCPFEETPLPPGPGIIIMNPEYGERLGEAEQLNEVYKEIGNFFKQKAGGYTGYVFTGNLELAKVIGLKASRRFEFFTGKIDARLLKFELYEGSRKAGGEVAK